MITFEDKSANRVFNQYQKQVDHIIQDLKESDKEEIKLEITSHLYESMAADQEEKEIDKLLNAIDKLGKLTDYLEPIVADKLIENAGATMNPKTLARAFVYNFGQSSKRTAIFAVFSLMYFFVITLFCAGIAKIFIPEVGFYVDDNTFFIGIVENGGANEVLGYWIIPMAFSLGAILYILSTKVLKMLTLMK